MLRNMSLMLIVVTGSAMIVSGAQAEVAPGCAGGGTATGTFHCSGPVLHPVCEEGPPWTCPIKGNVGSGLMEQSDDNGGGGHPQPAGIALSTLLNRPE